MAKINSNQVAFVDLTENRKLDVYINSNLPITQIKNSNLDTYTPDWSVTNLQLRADIYLNSSEVTPKTIEWYAKINQTETLVSTTPYLTITTNVLSDNPIVTYICKATYQNLESQSQITFSRIDTGLDGTNGVDGTGVTILGSYNTLDELQTAHPTGEAGDSYIVDGDLYVWAADNAQWENVGNIQGPAGADGKDAKNIILSGDSQVFKVSKSGIMSPSIITVTAQAINTSVTNWTYSTNGGQTFLSTIPNGVSRNGNIVTIAGSNIDSNSIVIKASDGEISDVFTIYKAVDGSDGSSGNDGAPAPIAFLTNENITFSANAQGQIPATTITSNVVAYSGDTKITPQIGTLTGVPTGMSVKTSVVSNEIMITMTILNNSTFGSASSNMGVISIPVISPVSTVLYLTWSKVNTGATGETGATGSDAYTVLLTNESHVFPGDVSNATASTTTTQALAYKGSAAQTVTIVSVNGVTANTSSTATGIAGLSFMCSALSGTSPIITFTSTTDFKTANGTIPIVLTVGGITFTKQFSYSIAFKGNIGATGTPGTAGNPATSYWLISSASVVQKTSTGTIACTPSTLTFTAKSQTGVASPTDYAGRWVISYSTNGTTYTELYKSTTNEASKTITVGTTYKTIKCQMYLAGGTSTLLDEQIIPIVSDGIKGDAGVDAVTFQIYAPNGYLLTSDLPSLTLQTFAYEGSNTISSGATFQWYSWDNDAWVSISGSTNNSLTVIKTDVLKSNSYKCEMTYKSKIYTATATVEDKTDIYDSLIRVNAKYSVNNTLYWILYATIYSEDGERDALLGPISDTAPIGAAAGSYWYKVDNTVCTVTLMKYTGTEWVSTTDTQELQYDWFLFKDTEDMVTLGESSKVKIVIANDFSHTCNVQCNISDSNYILLSRNNQSLTDPSDPIVSNEAPSNPTNGQMWIKTNTDGSYILSVWNSRQNQWAVSNTDNQNKVYTTKPTSYKAGDIWLIGGDYQPTIYKSGVAQTDKYLVGTMLKAQYSSTTYKDSDWVEALSYKEQLNDLQEHIDTYNQYFSFDNSGVIMTAKDANGNVSDFKTKLTNTELGFYQGDDKVAHINDNTLIISKAQINTELSVVGNAPTLKVGNFIFIQESNGSFSISTDIS